MTRWAMVSLVVGLAAAALTITPTLPTATAAMLAQTADADPGTYDFEIITIPALAGITVSLDGMIRTTNAEGRATFPVPRIEGETDTDAAQRAVVETTELEIDDRTIARYARPVARARSLTLMYSRYYQTAFDFTDAKGAPIPNTRIENTNLKSSTGEVRDVDVNEDVWLLGSRVAGSALPEVKEVFWTINDVTVDGASVAHRGQTKFFPEYEAQVSSHLLLFDVSFHTVDAFFGVPAGDYLTIGTPSGRSIVLELEDGGASMEQLPRGEYEVVIEGSGLRIGRPVTLTRDQDLRLLYYSRLDIFVVILGLAGFLVLPFVIGRRRRKLREQRIPDPSSDSDDSEQQFDDVVQSTLTSRTDSGDTQGPSL